VSARGSESPNVMPKVASLRAEVVLERFWAYCRHRLTSAEKG